MKMHRVLAEAAAAVVHAVFKENRVLDHALAAAFSNHPQWGKRDRSFIAETVFEVVRWRRALAFVADHDETAAMCAAQWRRMGYELPDWWIRRGISAATMAERESALAEQPRVVRESIPDWLDELGEAQLGAAWEREIHALNLRAPVVLRVNRLLGTREETREWLAANGVEFSPVDGFPDALRLPDGRVLPKPLRGDGRIEIQDAASQAIAPLLDPKPGEFVIDACAGAGGKTLHLAALMNNQGTIHAFDIEARKLEELRQRARRAGVRCIRTGLIDEAMVKRMAGAADRLLIDAPCSGLGTLRRQPDLKWRLKPGRLKELCALQRHLLETYPAMLKPGGFLVYATCSILPDENRRAVEHLLSRGGFSFIRELDLSPASAGHDGFYAALLRRDGV